MHLKAMVEQVWRWTWRPCLCDFEAELEGNTLANFIVINKQLWRFSWRLLLSEIEGVLGSGSSPGGSCGRAQSGGTRTGCC